MSGLIALATKHIRENEGFRLYLYDDRTGLPIASGSTVIGHPTVGYGRNIAARGINQAEADLMFLNDLPGLG